MTNPTNPPNASNTNNDLNAETAPQTPPTTPHTLSAAPHTPPAEAPKPRPTLRRRTSLIIVSLLAIIGGVAGSWAYNTGEPGRQDQDTAIVRAAIDPSQYITSGDYNNVSVPIRNDSPYAVIVIGVYLPTAPQIRWDSAWAIIQPGGTGYLRVTAPYNCPAIPHTLKHPGPVPVLLQVLTTNGNSHAGLRTSVSGVLQYAADYCATATKTKT